MDLGKTPVAKQLTDGVYVIDAARAYLDGPYKSAGEATTALAKYQDKITQEKVAKLKKLPPALAKKLAKKENIQL